MRIPYVQQPLRFEMAEPPLPWEGIRDATKRSDLCPQIRPENPGIFIGVEDCLYLTVHVPEHILKNRRLGPACPVLVFIHGGNFLSGSGDDYGGRYFMDEDIILVAFNYRLGALGLLTTGDGEILGNMGLKDSIMALKWVQNNIRYFGGNPAKVTVMGENSGGAAASLLLVSPMGRGLFSGMIMQSATALSPWALSRNPVDTARKFATKLNCNGSNTRELALCLKTKDPLSVVLANEEMIEPHANSLGELVPTVETPVKFTGERIPRGMMFLSEHPGKSLADGRFFKVPVLMGIKKDEGLKHVQAIMKNAKLLEELNNEWKQIAPIALKFSNLGLPTTQTELISEKIRKYYFGNGQITQENVKYLTDLYSDRLYNHGVLSVVALLAKYAPVFPYHFSFQENQSRVSVVNNLNIKGGNYTDALRYFFELEFMKNFNTTREERVFSENLIKLWTSFIYNGVPRSESTILNPWFPISAKETSSENIIYLYDLNQHFKTIKSPFTHRMNFWNELIRHELREETRFVQYRKQLDTNL